MLGSSPTCRRMACIGAAPTCIRMPCIGAADATRGASANRSIPTRITTSATPRAHLRIGTDRNELVGRIAHLLRLLASTPLGPPDDHAARDDDEPTEPHPVHAGVDEVGDRCSPILDVR